MQNTHYSIYTINNTALQKVIKEENNSDPERTWWDLDMLQENIANNLWEILDGRDTAIIELDHDKKEVTLLWEPLEWFYDSIWMRNEGEKERVYNHFLNAIRHAKIIWRYDEIFKNLKWPELFDDDGIFQEDRVFKDEFYTIKWSLTLQKKDTTFPHYQWDRNDIEAMNDHLKANATTLLDYIKNVNIKTREDLFLYLQNSKDITPYQKKSLMYIQKRSDMIPVYIKVWNESSAAHFPSKSVVVDLLQNALVATISNNNFDAMLALTVLHEYNHLFNNFTNTSGFTIFTNDSETDRLRELEASNDRKTQLLYEAAQKYNEARPYKDFFRPWEEHDEYIIGSKDEFLTESVSNEHFMQWLSIIPYNNEISRYDHVIKANLQWSWINYSQNTLLYWALDFYYTNLNAQTRKLKNSNLGWKFYAKDKM